MNIEDLRSVCASVLSDISLKSLTTFKIGGLAKFVVYPQNFTEYKALLHMCKEKCVEYYILGAGSNILADDGGFDGVIICTKKLNNISKNSPCRVRASCGVMLANLVRFCADNGLTGLEWAINIPGTVGGAVVMNAGAFGGEMAKIVESVTILNNGVPQVLENSKLFFNYRHSVFTNKKNYAIMEVVFKLKKEAKDQIALNTRQIICKRTLTQNVGYPSAGSVFRRENDLIPAKLIEECGLKGERVGDAMVSPVHSGYIVNLGKATCGQVLALIEKVKSRVHEKFNATMQCEIIHLKGKNCAKF